MENQSYTISNKLGSRLKIKSGQQQIIFVVLLFVCLSGLLTPPLALLLGLVVANVTGHPFLHLNHKATTVLLQVSVVGLGFGMNANSALLAGKEGFTFTIISIFSTLFLGYFIGEWCEIEKKTAHLISCGTAICGGSAIAAIAPVVEADEKQTSVALGVIFILNSVALFLFPVVGHWLHLSQHDFGLWCAIAIHDTSSVVGAANKYGTEALQVATTVKLGRALWIIPVALITSCIFKNEKAKIKIPYFIGLFVVAMLGNTFIPQISFISSYIVFIAKTGLTVTLFLIGAGLNWKIVKTVGVKPLVQGLLLWGFILITSLVGILAFN